MGVDEGPPVVKPAALIVYQGALQPIPCVARGSRKNRFSGRGLCLRRMAAPVIIRHGWFRPKMDLVECPRLIRMPKIYFSPAADSEPIG